VHVTTGLPLAGQVTTLRMPASEGTWMSVDVAPDDGLVVFDLLGGLQLMPLGGGMARRLATGDGFDAQPRVSPDGRWIAFVSDRGGADNLWLMDRRDGALRQLSHNEHTVSISPSWSPDGSKVLVAECLSYHSEPRLRWYPVGGGDAHDLLDSEGRPVLGCGGVVSPDGGRVYFAQRDPLDALRYLMPIAQVRCLDLESGRVHSLTEGRSGGVRPCLSSDGSLLAYATRERGDTVLRVRELGTGVDRSLAAVERDRQDYGRAPRGDLLPGYAFVPDGSAVLVSSGGRLRRISVVDGVATTVPFTAEISLPMAPRARGRCRVEQGPVRARVAREAAWSPDGRRVAFSALARIHVADVVSGTPPRRLTTATTVELQPVWSPDGEWIAYRTWSGSAHGQLWVARPDADEPRRRIAGPGAFYTDPCFTPDGGALLVLRGVPLCGARSDHRPVTLDLVRIPLGPGPARVITAGFPGRRPHVVRAGAGPPRIYATDGFRLFSVAMDGGDERTHLELRGRFDVSESPQPVAEAVVVSPDGSQALGLINKQRWRLPVPAPDDGLVVVDVRSPPADAWPLTAAGADDVGWVAGGSRFHWTIGAMVHAVPAPSAPGLVDRRPTVHRVPLQVLAPRATGNGTTVLRGADVITMRRGDREGDATLHSRTDIAIDGNRFAAVGPTGSIPIPRDARVVELAGAVVVPGFIDSHAHWDYPASEVAGEESWSLRANLAYGVTAGLDTQSDDVANFVYQDLVDCGEMLGPRAFMTGPGIFGVNDYKPYEIDVASYDEALACLRRYRDHYRVHRVKLYLVGNRRQRQWFARACRELGMLATTEGYGDPVLHLAHALDGLHGNEHALSDGELHADVIGALARAGTTHTSTLTITHFGLAGVEYFLSRRDLWSDPKVVRFYPHDVLAELTARRRVWGNESEFSVATMAAQAAKLHRSGVPVGVGSHGEVQGLGYHWELEMLAMGGMTPTEILRAATVDGARVIGLDADLGSIEPGKLADLVVLHGNPLDDIRHTQRIAAVMKDGVLYDGETLDVR
jgi:imidazolonepropionase-like amidohydrolase/Tol biopolymer transport system component